LAKSQQVKPGASFGDTVYITYIHVHKTRQQW